MRRIYSMAAKSVTVPVHTTPALPNATQGSPYSFSLTAAHGQPPYVWSYTGTLIPGLTLPASGIISGTPTVSGTSTLAIVATDANGLQTPSMSFILTTAASGAPTITSTSPLPSAVQGVPYSYQFTGNGGTPPYTWSLTGTLVSGLSMSSSGLLSGTPGATATNSVVVKLMDSASATATGTFVLTTIPVTAGYDGTIKVGTGANSNRFVNGSGQVVQLRGANMSALEFVGVQQFSNVSAWGGVQPAWSVYKTWKPNTVRIPLNVASWMGYTCQTAHGNPATAFSGVNVKADPQNDYRATVIQGVRDAQAQGCYPILDLHWNAPQVTLAGSTQYILADGQAQFADYSTCYPFWTSLAGVFGNAVTPQSGINNNGIIFELFNEPYMSYYASGSTLAGLMLNGGTVSKFTWAVGAYSVQPTGGVQILGYQQALNAIRSNGSTNLVICNGNSFSQELSQYLTYLPTDAQKQVAFGWHPYPNGTYPYANGDVYGQVGSDPNNGTASFDTYAKAVLAAGYPLIITEDGGTGGIGASATPTAEPHMAFMQNWADSHGASYIFWQWNNPQTVTSTFQGYISGTTLTVTSGSASLYQSYCGTTGYQFQVTGGSGSTWTINYSQTVGSVGSPVTFGAVTNNYATTGTVAAPTAITGEGSTSQSWMVNHA